MGEVVFVREVVGERDLVLALSREGTPLWALDLDRALQWWYPGGNTAAVREEIAHAWPDFELMPVLAHSPEPGRHAAIELGRRAEASAEAAAREAEQPPDLVSRVQDRWTSFSRPARMALVAVGIALLIVVGASWLGGPGPGPAPLPVGADGRTVTVPQSAGASCSVRGELAHQADGRLLVCVSDGQADPWTLAWRPAG